MFSRSDRCGIALADRVAGPSGATASWQRAPRYGAARMRRRAICSIVVLAVGCAGCGGKTSLFNSSKPIRTVTVPVTSTSAHAPASGSSTTSSPLDLGIPALATKNTSRVDGSDPVSDAAGVALAVFPSVAPGTHPTAVTLAPTDDWPAAIAASSLMAPPFRAPVLLSGPSSLPAITLNALKLLAPTGNGSAGGAQVIRIGDVPAPSGVHSTYIGGNGPYALAAAIDSYETHERGRPSVNVVVASTDAPAYAMPAAGYAAESGEPVLFVDSAGVPAPTAQALAAHKHPHIYVLGPPSVISASVVAELARYGTVKRISGIDPASTSVDFAEYRDPPCAFGQPCVHVPGSFGWAIRSPGHAYVLINQNSTLDAAAAAALSSSGGYGPQLLVQNPNSLPTSVLNYFLDYATPGYTQEGPTAAVYNHAWLIGDPGEISVAVQGQVDSLLEAVPQR